MALYQTAVQVSTGTAAALGALVADRGHSRDATMRELLIAHVERQEARGSDARLSHLSTLLRFPLRPFARSAAFPGRRLPLRLPTSLVAKAQATALRLPGQPLRRGPRDYQARPLTDAVTSAITEAHPIADPELDGLMPLLRHRSAESLWRLAVAGTLRATGNRGGWWSNGVSLQVEARARTDHGDCSRSPDHVEGPCLCCHHRSPNPPGSSSPP